LEIEDNINYAKTLKSQNKKLKTYLALIAQNLN